MTRAAIRDAAASKGAPRDAAEAGAHDLPARTAALLLAVVVVVGSVLRLIWPRISPPGLNQDEAISAWISWCLLHTGRDLAGQAWPIFYSHGIGDNPTMLYFYTLMPFQALGGLSVWTTRLPAELAGIASIVLAYVVGARMFGRWIGLIAAAILATNPWHLFLSRFGVGASQCPLYALAPLALMLAAGFPIADDTPREARPVLALLAGLAAGLSCYGFHPMRLYFPAFFAMLVAVNAREWRDFLRTRSGQWTALMLVVGLGVTAGPLAWQHVVDPGIVRRWEMTRLWEPGDSPLRIAQLVAGRWWAHYLPDFLFVTGERFDAVKPIGGGEFGWHLLPCMLAGAAFAFARLRSSRSARTLLALLAVYPAGDLISRYVSVHSLRSAPGVATLALLAAYGAVEGVRRLGAARGRAFAVGTAAALLLGATFFDGRFLVLFFGKYNRSTVIYNAYRQDMVEACEWLKPRLDHLDAVFITTRDLNQPFAVSLVELQWDPKRWFREPRDIRTWEGWDLVVRYGKMHFLYGDWCRPEVEALQRNGREDHGVFIVRPGELGLANPDSIIHRPDGSEALWICERTF